MTAGRTIVRVVASLGALLLLLPAAILFLIGLLVFADELDKTAVTTGTISVPPGPPRSTELQGDAFDAGACVLVVEFVVAGRTHAAESGASSDNCVRGVGEAVPVHYDPSDPDENTVGSSNPRIVGAFMMGGAVVWTAFVLVVVWLVFRTTRAGDTHGGRVVPPGTAAPIPPGPVLAGPVPAIPAPMAPVAVPAPEVVWDPSDTQVRPERPGWYPTGDGTIERWYNGLSWSDATRRPTV